MELNYFSPPLLISVATLVATWFLIGLWRNRRIPPGPWGLPLLGYYPFLKVTHEDYLKLSKIYGNVFSFRTIGGRLIIVLNGAKVIKEVLVNRADEFDGRPHGNNLVHWVSEGIGITQEEGLPWSEQRKFFTQTIKNFGVGKSEIEERIHDEINQMLSDFRKSELSKSVDVYFSLSYAVSSVTSHLLFGKKFDRDHTFRRTLDIFHSFIDLFIGKMHIFIGYPFDLLMKLVPSMRKREAGRKAYAKFINNIVEEQMETFDSTHLRGYVDSYLQNRNELQKKGKLSSSSFTEERLKANTLNLFLEGTESVGFTTSCMLQELSKHPEVQKLVQEELDNIVGRERLPSWADRVKLPYLDATIQELFRVAAPFLVTTMYSNFEETTIEGYRIPRRSTIIASLYSVHVDPKLFPKPEVFDPTRFLNDEGKRIKREGPYPFGLGKRSCIGESLGQMEVFLVISAMLQNFTLHPGNKELHLKLETRK